MAGEGDVDALLGTGFIGGAIGMLRPDAECPHCDGSGQVPVPGRPGVSVKCACVVKKEAIRYLTPTFSDAKYEKNIRLSALAGKSILFHQYEKKQFRNVVKSYLLNTGMKYSFLAPSGYDVIQDYLQNTPAGGFDRMKSVDLLILSLFEDPPNKNHSQIFISLFEKRDDKGLHTWVWTPHDIDHMAFTGLYGESVATYMKAHFKILKQQAAGKPSA